MNTRSLVRVCAVAMGSGALLACSSGGTSAGDISVETPFRPDAAASQGAAGAAARGDGAASVQSPAQAEAGDAGDDGEGASDEAATGAEAGPAVDSGASDEVADASGEGPADAQPLPAPSYVCPTGASWAPGVVLPISTASDDVLGAITPDELTIAFTAGTGAGATWMIADRDSASAAFGTPNAIATSDGFDPPGKVALSPDGLRLLVVRSDNTAFGVLTRSSRGVAFVPPPEGGEVDVINANVVKGEIVVHIDDPVIGGRDQTLYYSMYGGGLTNTLIESSRATASLWASGVPALSTDGELLAVNPLLRRPTGVSADDLTLFYWDEVDGTEKAVWRDSPAAAFDHVETIGVLRGAVPNANCDTLYYSAEGTDGGSDLFAAGRL